MLIGAYVGDGDYDGYEAWLGRDLDIRKVHFGAQTWQGILGAINSTPHSPVPVMANIHAWPKSRDAQGRVSDQMDRAVNNDMTLVGWWKGCAELLVEVGFGDAMLCPFHEFNHADPKWQGWHALGREAKFRKAYENYIAAFMSVPGANFEFVANFARSGDLTGDLSRYLVDGIDYIGVNFYDNSPRYAAGASGTVVWLDVIQPALARVAALADAKAKRLVVPEWGWTYPVGNENGGGDNLVFGTNAFAWMRERDVYIACYHESAWSDGEHRLRSGVLPKAATFYRAEVAKETPPPSPPVDSCVECQEKLGAERERVKALEVALAQEREWGKTLEATLAGEQTRLAQLRSILCQ